MIVQRLIVQKRPTIEAKETYYRGKRDLQCRGRSWCMPAQYRIHMRRRIHAYEEENTYLAEWQ